ncbi:MAG: hypothetical protein ACI8X5_001068 [Planctomycetota bacterium]|jgi:hypothetical protein
MNRTLTILVTSLLCASVCLGAVTSQESAAVAPDGRPGLGTERTAHELGRLFASPDEEQEEFLRALHDLPSDILVQREMARRNYRTAGYFELLDPRAEESLKNLHGMYREVDQAALATLTTRTKAAEVFSKMFIDLRFQLRMGLLRSFELEASQLRRGLLILHASSDGVFDLRDSEAKAIAWRIDLSAAILRSVLLDLDALRDRGGKRAPGSPDPALLAELIGLTRLTSESDRVTAFKRLRKKLGERLERLESSLFWPRLEQKLVRDLAKREALLDDAEQELGRVERFLLIPPHDESPSPQIAELSASERHRFAMASALRGIVADPLNADLTYWLGVATELIGTPRESRSWFDRYLALRGVRPQQLKSTKDTDLTKKEAYAVERVLQAYTGGPLGR